MIQVVKHNQEIHHHQLRLLIQAYNPPINYPTYNYTVHPVDRGNQQSVITV